MVVAGLAAEPPALASALRPSGSLSTTTARVIAQDLPPPAAPLAPTLGELLENSPGTYGLVVGSVATGEYVRFQATRPFHSASLYKILLAYAVLHEVEQGRWDLDQTLDLTEADAREPEPAAGLAVGQSVTLREALGALLGQSSNLAAHRLLRLVGRAQLNHRLAELGLATTRVPLLEEVSPWPSDGPAPEVAVTTPGEMADFLQRLLRGELLGEAARTELARGLQVAEALDPVVASLPAEAAVFTKLGELEDASNVAGWLLTRQGPVLLAIFSEGTDPGTARSVIRQLAPRVYDYFNR